MTLGLAAGATAVLMMIGPLSAQTPAAKAKAKASTVPRTADGHPDLQGVWTNATITPMERPAALTGKATLSDAEAKAYEAHDQQTNTLDESDSPLVANTGSGAVGAYNNLFVDRGSELARVDGVKRTSLIVDPPDGKIPYLANRPVQMRTPGFGSYNSVKDRPLSERCILGFGSTAGPPMLPVLYNNNYQIVQTRGRGDDSGGDGPRRPHHSAERQHAPSNIRRLFGDSIGHWEGDTLVVDTTNFTAQNALPRIDRKSACDRALHARRRADHSLPCHHRRRYRVLEAVDARISLPRDGWPGLRVRLPRRKLRDAGHPGRRAQA